MARSTSATTPRSSLPVRTGDTDAYGVRASAQATPPAVWPAAWRVTARPTTWSPGVRRRRCRSWSAERARTSAFPATLAARPYAGSASTGTARSPAPAPPTTRRSSTWGCRSPTTTAGGRVRVRGGRPGVRLPAGALAAGPLAHRGRAPAAGRGRTAARPQPNAVSQLAHRAREGLRQAFVAMHVHHPASPAPPARPLAPTSAPTSGRALRPRVRQGPSLPPVLPPLHRPTSLQLVQVHGHRRPPAGTRCCSAAPPRRTCPTVPVLGRPDRAGVVGRVPKTGPGKALRVRWWPGSPWACSCSEARPS